MGTHPPAWQLPHPAAAQAGTWQIDPNHSSAPICSQAPGRVHRPRSVHESERIGEYDPADPSKTSLEATIDATGGTRSKCATTTCAVALFRCAKVSDDYVSFKQVKVVGPGKLQIGGDLTITA